MVQSDDWQLRKPEALRCCKSSMTGNDLANVVD